MGHPFFAFVCIIKYDFFVIRSLCEFLCSLNKAVLFFLFIMRIEIRIIIMYNYIKWYLKYYCNKKQKLNGI